MVKKYLKLKDLEQMFEDELDDVWGEYIVGSGTYSASEILKAVDPATYNVEFASWLDSKFQDDVLGEEEDGSVFIKK